MPRSYLFVPAHEERKVGKALASEADAVILDLEDGVPEASKADARDAIRRLQASGDLPVDKEVWIRVNPAASPHFAEDVRAVDGRRVSGVVLPKAEEDERVDLVRETGARTILLIETVKGLDDLARVVSRLDVERVAPGTWDLALDLGLVELQDPDESELIWQVRGQVVLQSRRLGLRPPIDGIYARLDDDAGLRAACARALRMGFAGKQVIHPRQIPTVHEVFSPDPEALAFAREAVQAYREALKEGRGAIQVRGRLVDRPVVERAQALLDKWGDR